MTQSVSDSGSDPIGRATMSSSITEAENYHRYLYHSLKPYLGKKVWEIGSGYGQYTEMLLEDGFSVLASDIDSEMLNGLDKIKARFPGKLETRYVDLCRPETIDDCASWTPDSIISLNVLEHIENDLEAVRAIYSSVPVRTRLVFLTPAFQSLYGFMDSDAGHYRRYTRASLSEVFSGAGWNIQKTFYLNSVGGIGWFLRNRVILPKDCNLDSDEVNDNIRFFDKYCVGVTSVLDKILAPLFGQSVVVVAQKND